MSRELARQGLTTAVAALQATYPGGLNVEYPNQVELDPATQIQPFLRMKIIYQDSWQASLGPQKHLRAMGWLVLEAWVNAGQGTKPSNDILTHFYPSLHMSDQIPNARTFAVKFDRNFNRAGWDVQPAVIPFWFDEVQ